MLESKTWERSSNFLKGRISLIDFDQAIVISKQVDLFKAVIQESLFLENIISGNYIFGIN